MYVEIVTGAVPSGVCTVVSAPLVPEGTQRRGGRGTPGMWAGV